MKHLDTFPFISQMRVVSLQVFFFGKKGEMKKTGAQQVHHSNIFIDGLIPTNTAAKARILQEWLHFLL